MRNPGTFFVAAVSILAALASSSSLAQARPGKAHYVGSGLAYPTLNHALFVNSTALVDSPQASLQASYLLDPENIHASLSTGGSSVGFGLGFRQNGPSSIEEFGLAGRLNIMTLGATLRTRELENPDADIAATFDFGSTRLSIIGRGMEAGFDRVDAGLGFIAGPFTIGLDAKKPLASGDDSWLFDAGLAAGDGRISAGFGYTFAYNGGDFFGGDIHAGISLGLTSGIAAEAFYKPSTHEWNPGEWVIGARFEL